MEGRGIYIARRLDRRSSTAAWASTILAESPNHFPFFFAIFGGIHFSPLYIATNTTEHANIIPSDHICYTCKSL